MTAAIRFGNIVTMERWDDLWLNEALASWVSTAVAAPQIDPIHDVWNPWIVNTIERSMVVDSTSSHPIIVPIHKEKQLATAFDVITYLKGCSGQYDRAPSPPPTLFLFLFSYPLFSRLRARVHVARLCSHEDDLRGDG